MTNEELIVKIKAEIERRKAKAEAERVLYPKTILSAKNFLLINDYVELLSFLSTLESEKPMNQDGLEEEIERYLPKIPENPYNEELRVFARYFAQWGAEWQKEQDQPITGNSLEQEWLRYVDKKKKECGGELPSLGEYGWLQIARHFSEWQKDQMMKDAVEGQVFGATDVKALYEGKVYVVSNLVQDTDYNLHRNDKVRIIIIKEN